MILTKELKKKRNLKNIFMWLQKKKVETEWWPIVISLFYPI